MSGASFALPIEAGHVKLFLRAIGAEECELAELAPGLPVPALTFVQVADHFDPAFPRRPRPSEPWLGSASTPSGVAAGSDLQQGLFHVDQHFTYHRHPRIGETLSAHRLEPRRWSKQGRRGGALEFIELVTEFRDATGEEVVTAAWRDVRTERRHSEVSNTQAPEPVEVPTGAALVPLAENITRTQLVMYAGVSGDFHPLHHDEPFVAHLGYPSVFVPGMLTMAMVGRVVAEHTPITRVRTFGGRFHAQLWPGDSLVAFSTEVDAPNGQRRIEVIALNQARALVFSAHALAEA